MSLWSRVHTLPESSIILQNIYNKYSTSVFVIRRELAEFIEKTVLLDHSDDPGNTTYYRNFYFETLTNVEIAIEVYRFGSNEAILSLELEKATNSIKEAYENYPDILYQTFQVCLRFEEVAVLNAEIHPKLLHVGEFIQYYITLRFGSFVSPQPNEVYQLQNKIAIQIGSLIDFLKRLQNLTLINLIAWKREQQLSGVGLKISIELKYIRHWVNIIANLQRQIKTKIKEVFQGDSTWSNLALDHLSTFTNYDLTLDKMSSELTLASFIIHRQPPQIMEKKIVKDFAIIEYFLGNFLKDSLDKLPTVYVKLLDEEQAAQTFGNPGFIPDTVNVLNNNSAVFEYDEDHKTLRATFRNVSINNCFRTNFPNKFVLEKKFFFYFYCQSTVDEQSIITLRTVSLPIIVVTHESSQSCSALATIIWSAMFWNTAFPHPPSLYSTAPVTRLIQILNIKCNSMTQRGLTRQHIQYLTTKLVGNIDTTQWVTWDQFARNPFSGKNFSFWNWFYSALKLISNDAALIEIWKLKSLMGFVSREHATGLLIPSIPGTFLIRFSESIQGELTVSIIIRDSVVISTDPLSSGQSVLRLVRDNTCFEFLHPGIAKHDEMALGGGFRKLGSSTTGLGYVRVISSTV